MKKNIDVTTIYHINDAIRMWVKPTHFITLSLCQARAIPNDESIHGVSWLKGDDAIYTKMHERFVASLSKQLVTRTAWKFHHPILRSALGLEGDSKNTRTHAHMVIARPDNVEEERFCSLVRKTAAENPWVMNGEHAVQIQAIGSVSEMSRSISYTTKDGFDRMSFT